MKKPVITLLLGTARKERASDTVYNYLTSTLEGRDDLVLNPVDIASLASDKTIAAWQEEDVAKEWRAIVAKSDAFIIVSPEYNYGIPGELKMLLDMDFDGYLGKPVLLAGVSSGRLGGAHAVPLHMAMYGKFGLVWVPSELYFGNVGDFAKQSKEEQDEAHKKRVERAVQKMLIYCEHMDGIATRLSEVA